DENLLVVVVYPTPTHVERCAGSLEVESSEAQAALGALERPQPANCPGLERERGDLIVRCVCGAEDDLAHVVETLVGVVDVGLLGCQIRVRHVPRMPRSVVTDGLSALTQTAVNL